jgi:hypothetical protein
MTGHSEPLFHEVQGLPLARLRILLAIPPFAMLLLLVWQAILGHPWGTKPMSNASLIGWTSFLWLVYLRLITVRLVTDVRSDQVTVAMRGFWRGRHIPLNEIRSVKVVAYDPVRDYGGYGIRIARGVKAYIASGNRGVRLEFANSGAVLIGSERPEDLASVINSHVSIVPTA